MRNRHRRQRWTPSVSFGDVPVSGNRPCRFAENPPASGPGVFMRSMSFRRSFVVPFFASAGHTEVPRRPRPTWRLGDSRDHKDVGHPGNRSASQAPADRGRSRGRTPSIRGGSRRAEPGADPCLLALFLLHSGRSAASCRLTRGRFPAAIGACEIPGPKPGTSAAIARPGHPWVGSLESRKPALRRAFLNRTQAKALIPARPEAGLP
jgi:hypothetical protein